MKEENEGNGATLWANSVSKAVLETVGVEERKRQEAINELIFTERDFVRDLEYLRDVSGAFLFFVLDGRCSRSPFEGNRS